MKDPEGLLNRLTKPANEKPNAIDARPSDTEVAGYLRDGYLVRRGLLTPNEIAAVKSEAGKFARGDYPIMSREQLRETLGRDLPPQPLPEVPADASDDMASAHLLTIHFPHWVSSVIADVVLRHPSIVPIVASIATAHLCDRDDAVKCLQSVFFVKPPGKPGVPWHQDESFDPTRDRSLTGVWIALDDATTSNGCLWVLPGSHRHGYVWPRRPNRNPAIFGRSPESYGFDDSGAVPVEAPAGTVIFFNGYLLHRSFQNSSDGYRRALVSHYSSSWTPLHPKPHPADLAGTRRVADPFESDKRLVVPVSGTDPYAWKGYDQPPNAVFVKVAQAE